MTDAPTFERPSKPVAAACVIRDADGRILCVEPVYRPEWLLPGGYVEAGESPHAACGREVAEELGLDLPVGRMLAVDHLTGNDPYGESLVFMFDGGRMGAELAAEINLQAEELRSWRFLPVDEAKKILASGLAARIDAVIAAADGGGTLYLEDGLAPARRS